MAAAKATHSEEGYNAGEGKLSQPAGAPALHCKAQLPGPVGERARGFFAAREAWCYEWYLTTRPGSRSRKDVSFSLCAAPTF